MTKRKKAKKSANIRAQLPAISHSNDRLNLFGVAAAALLLSYSFSFAPPTVIVKDASAMLGSAAVGVGAAVEPNEYNTLAQALAEKEANLIGRERAISDVSENQEQAAMFAVYSFIVGLILCALVAANFYFDWRREKRHSAAVNVRVVGR